jgi:secondary thiamine-phosphate synthase enzyme
MAYNLRRRRHREHRMRSHRQELWFETPTRVAFANITREVEAALARSGIREGLCLVNAMHISASVFINDDEPGLHHDFGAWSSSSSPTTARAGITTAPARTSRQPHQAPGDGREVTVAITGGRLDFGPWEQIFYGEFDGKRRKRVLVKVIGE